MRPVTYVLIASTLLALSACAELAEPAAPAEDGSPSALASSAQGIDADLTAAGNYVMLRHDPRRCVFPLCGGFWVDDLNRPRTRCADGTLAEECYVADVDLEALGLSESQRYELLGEAGSGRAILRGRIGAQDWGDFGELGRLYADAAWTAATAREPVGAFLQLERLPILCLVEPCFDIRSQILNRARQVMFSGVNFRRVGADDETLDRALEALDSGELLVAGRPRRDRNPGPAGTYGRTLHVSQLYLPVTARECIDAFDCTTSVYTEPVERVEDCYCPTCPVPMNAEEARRNAEGWGTYCEGLFDCPPPPCAPPPEVGCFDSTCQYVFD